MFTGNFMVPKIWSGSEFAQQYGVKFKFSSASGDPVAVFMNCYFQLAKILALGLPESSGGIIYTPWIVSVHSPGAINIDYGIINDISVKRDVLTLNDYGQSTSLEVEISITNLRPYLYQEKPKWASLASKHSASVTNFIATLTGQNISTGMKLDEQQKFRETIAQLNYAESVSVKPRQIKMGVNRFLGRPARYINRVKAAGKDKWSSVVMIGNQLVGNDAYKKTVNELKNATK